MSENTDQRRCLQVSPSDNVCVLVDECCENGQILSIIRSETDIALKEPIPRGHKVAVSPIPVGGHVRKFGQVIGVSRRDIQPGEHVHIHNIVFAQGVDFSGQFILEKTSFAIAPTDLPKTFNGYLREDGRAGTRNYLLVLAPVNCSATVVKRIAEPFSNGLNLPPSVDGVIPVTYGGGCAQSTEGHYYSVLGRTIAGWLGHPNVVGALVVGLGCESMSCNQLRNHFLSSGITDSGKVSFFDVQDVGGTTKAIKHGVRLVEEMLGGLPTFERTALPVSLLDLGLNCGGSDSFSALTANPALGIASDILVSLGGSAVLAEVPECHGAETYLASRCLHSRDREKLARIFAWWQKYGEKHGINMNDNLALGNMEGGISTILEKSLGAVSKAGSAPISQVLDYSERITAKGCLFMNTPGFDPVSVTGLVAGGCNLVAFTTGRGSAYGCSIAPTLKISTNTQIYKKLPDDIDLDAGTIIDGESVADVGKRIYLRLLEVAGGAATRSEVNGMGREEFVPWHVGETL